MSCVASPPPTNPLAPRFADNWGFQGPPGRPRYLRAVAAAGGTFIVGIVIMALVTRDETLGVLTPLGGAVMAYHLAKQR